MERQRQYGAEPPFVNSAVHSRVHRLWMFDGDVQANSARGGDNAVDSVLTAEPTTREIGL